jgi:small conductance mechanosensitive channel
MNESIQDILRQLGQGVGAGSVTALRITLIALVAWLLAVGLKRAIRSFRIRLSSQMDDPESQKRVETLGRVFRYLATVVVSLVAGTLILGELGVSIAPILGAAGVVGLAVGFGAQSLVKDYFSGFFLLLENQIRVGDVVKLGEHAGLVEVVTLRYVQLRDYDGNVHFVPNGTISSVINLSREYGHAVMDIGVAYREDVDQVMEVMRAVGRELRLDESLGPRLLDDLEIAGVERWADSAVVIRCRFKCKALAQWDVRREYLRRLKRAFDQAGIEIPFPHLTIYAGADRLGQAPALPVSLARSKPMV